MGTGSGPGVLVIGEIEAARRVCQALREQGSVVMHLSHPQERELREALAAGVAAVAVLVRGDVAALRYALTVEHLRPGVRLVVTVFDATVADQLARTVPRCTVTSPATVSIPSVVGACLGDDLAAVYPSTQGWLAMRVDGTDPERFVPSARDRLRSGLGTLRGQLRPSDGPTAILLVGLLGLALTLLADLLLAGLVLGEPFPDAFYAATRVVATVGPGADGIPDWYEIFSATAMLATIGFTALVTAGLVDRAVSPRLVAVVGRRVLPRSGHVIVVGLGQVGIRLCLQLRRMNVPVVAVERDPLAENLRLARDGGVPVLIGNASDRRMLDRLRLDRARALACMGSDDLDNVEVAVAARAVSPAVRVVLRAGEHAAISETRSLFHVGAVCDIVALTALAVVHIVRFGTEPKVWSRLQGIELACDDSRRLLPAPARCGCGRPAAAA